MGEKREGMEGGGEKKGGRGRTVEKRAGSDKSHEEKEKIAELWFDNSFSKPNPDFLFI